MIDSELDFSAIRELYSSEEFQQLTQFAELLGSFGMERGLIGPKEADKIWSRHILNCAAVIPLLPDTGEVIDLGSGAGLPGIVVAVLRPGLSIVLLEPLLRRVTWLNEVSSQLELRNVRVLRGRAEDEAGRLRGSVVLSRAVARLPRLLTWSRPLLPVGGKLIALKGSGIQEEIAEVPQKQRAGWLWPPTVTKLTLFRGVEQATVVELSKK